MKSGSDTASIKNLEECSCAVRDWFIRNGMLLNPEKSEAMLIASPSIAKTFAECSGVAIADSEITFSVKLKSLGVTLDKTLSFDEHVKNTVKASNFHIKALRHIRPLLNKSIANSVACSIVATRLDYCNALLYGTSKTNLDKLQRIQNTLARVVAGTRKRDHITPVLKDLHWLPVEQRINYKIAVITHKVLQEKQPTYLAELVSIYQPRRSLRSDSQSLLSRSWTPALRIADRSFSTAAREIWTTLPLSLRLVNNLFTFKKLLKTHLFSVSYCV